MTAQTAEYGMEYLNHAQPKDVLWWIYNASDFPSVSLLTTMKGRKKLTIPCHQFAASVVGRLLNLLSENAKNPCDHIEFTSGKLFFIYGQFCVVTTLYIPINPFHGMTMPDGSPRTSWTREEFEQAKKELDA